MNQSNWMGIYRHWIWIGVPLMLATAFALWFLITGVISLTKRARLFKVPLVPSQEIGFDQAGRVALAMEGPRFTTRFSRVKFEMRGPDGQRVPSRPSLMRSRTSGFSTVTMELMTFNVPQPGRYQLIIAGLDPSSAPDPAHAVVFLRPHLEKSIAFTVGIVLSAGLFIVSLVFFVLRLMGVGLDE